MSKIIGAHSVIFSKDPDSDRAFFRDVLKFQHVDVVGGWLIFKLPPAELAIHPSDKNDIQELYLMCDNINDFVEEMGNHNIECDLLDKQDWGILTRIKLQGGGKVGVYQPLHPTP